MRYLVVSDIHANLEALEAVLERTAGEYDQIICCGDLVGYGADPNAVVDWAREHVAAVVRGNHDKAASGLESTEWFNNAARDATNWTQAQLTPENSAYIRALPKGPLAIGSFQIVHGSPLDEDEYVAGTGDARQTFPYLETQLTFFGHTHLQGGFLQTPHRIEPIGRPQPGKERAVLELDPDEVYLINPGSVGQPRDQDTRAAYALYDADGRMVIYGRLAYDVVAAQTKIRRAGLPDMLADRLGYGR